MNLPRRKDYGDGCCCTGISSSSSDDDRLRNDPSTSLNSTSSFHLSIVPLSRKHKRLTYSLVQGHLISVACTLALFLLSFQVTLGLSVETSMNSNSFLNGESGPSTSQSPFQDSSLQNNNIPTGSSSSVNNVIVPGPSSPSAQAGGTSPSVPQSYFINGYANLIQKVTEADLRSYGKNKSFQLQFRTVCPFGNIVNDDKFALRFSSSGYLTYLYLPQEVQAHRSQSNVADGHWHTITFKGSHIYFDDTKPGENFGTSIDISNNSTDPAHHILNFFDGFVGCIRAQPPSNSSLYGEPISAPYDELFKNLSKQGYQPCNDPQFDLSTAQCFQPESFVLCSKCQNNATCVFTDGKNECLCPDEALFPPFCSSYNPEEDVHHHTEGDLPVEPRELLHGAMEDHDDHFMSSTTGSSGLSSLSHSPALPSTTEHMAASSSIEQNRALPEPQTCPCVNNGKCVQESNGSWSCDCEGTGYRGKTCNNDVCDANPLVCGTKGKCFDDPEREAGFECYCKPGYAGERCEIDFNECLSNPCTNNGTCKDEVNTYLCICQPGYTGKNCETEIDECDSSPCENGGACQDLVADYHCDCPAGFEGKNCEINIDECKPLPCLNNGICLDEIANYSCNCDDTGFTGRNCEINIDDCERSPCQNGGNCTDGIKSYTCSCFPGYAGENCGIDIAECNPENSSDTGNLMGPCKNGATCYEKSIPDNYGYGGPLALQHIEFEYSSAAGYVCECQPGYEGENCEIDINECELTVEPCSSQGKCKDEVNSYRCECNKGFEGERCEIDINECEPSPCVEAKECRNLAGDYECECNDGYGGKNCTVALKGCIQNVCFNEGLCKSLYDESTDTHLFECSCKQGYTGTTCETRTTMAFNGSSIAEIVKNDDAFLNNKYFLSFSFRTTLPDVILALGAGGTYFSLGLVGGKLNLQSSLINSLQGMSSGSNLHDGNYHKVVVSINQTHAILSAGIEQVTLPIADSEDFAQQPTGFNTTILGDLKPNLAFLNKLHLDPFVGCMRDVMINNDRILPEEAENVNLTNILSTCSRKDQCNPSPCLNGGTCTDLWQRFTCNCPRPYLGSRCQYSYTAATFNHEETNNSLAIVDIPPRRFGGVFDISMFVRTRESRGTIFLLCDKERGLNGSYVEATITKNGNLVVQAKWVSESNGDETATKPEPYTVDGVLTDGHYHLISVQRDKTHVVIKVNDSEHFRKSHSNKPFSPTVMYIGGKPSHLLGQEPPAEQPNSDTHSGETSTNLPDTVDNNTEGTTQDSEPENEVITVPFQYQFKGIIQDVKVNLSGAEPQSNSGLSHSSQSPKDREKNLYVVEFFSLNLTDSVQPSPPLGRVTIQGLKQGEVSDEMCRNKTDQCFRGKCVTTWNDFRCDCWNTEEYAGKLCDIRLRCADIKCPDRSKCRNIGYTGFECVSDAAFDGKGYTTPHYILKSNTVPELNFNELSFRYRSKKPGNVIHMSNGSAFLRVSLEGTVNDGSIVFHFIDDKQIAIQNATVFDGEWHMVALKFSTIENSDYKNTVGWVFDRFESQTEFIYHSHQYLRDIVISPNLDIVVGSSLSIDNYGRPVMSEVDHDHIHSQYYRGCLKDIYIGNFKLPFVSPSRLRELNEDKNLSYIETTAPTAFYINERFHPLEQNLPPLGCTLCYEKDCKNGGHCSDPTQLYDCSCPDGFKGEICEVNIDECVDNMCSHGSTCLDGVNNYTCACPRGYEGWLCQYDINECEEGGNEKCKNGQCVDEVGQFSCDCNEEYTGTYCDKRKKSTCNDEPCEHGQCHDVPMAQPGGVSFRCDCDPGYQGETCADKIDFCKNVTCQNGGDCSNHPYGHRCNCVPGFDGLYCEINIDECKAAGDAPCKNGGICVDEINGYQCDCSETGFQGPFCEDDINECMITPYICHEPLFCENTIGRYICSCPDKTKCGSECDIPNPCYSSDGGNNHTCQNGGTCEPVCESAEDASATCLCPPSFIGDFCEYPDRITAPAGEGSVDILLIIIPVLAAILIAATIGIIILVRMARRKRATRGVYSPSQQEYCNPRVELDNVMKPPPEERLI